jgi:hypothetical protein
LKNDAGTVSSTDEDFPFAIRRGELLDRAVAILSTDARFPAGWLEGSLADGSADSFSDIDLHLCVGEKAWDEVWKSRAKLLTPEHSDQCARLIDRIATAVRSDDRSAMRDAHIQIFQELCRLGRAAFDRYGSSFRRASKKR